MYKRQVYEDPWSPWRLGAEALPIALVAQKPLDLLVLMIGTNDLKFTDAYGAAKGAERLIDLANMVQARKESSPVFPNGCLLYTSCGPPKSRRRCRTWRW